MQGRITKRSIETLKAGQSITDDKVRGFIARRLPSGRVTYGLKYQDPKTGRQRWLSLGVDMKPEAARRRAEGERGRIVGDGADPQGEREAARRNRAKAATVNSLLDAHLNLYVEARGLRSAREIRRCFDVYVRSKLGNLPAAELRRGHIVELLDEVAAEHGETMADRVLAHLRKALNWHAARDESFVVPIVRGMSRTRPSERARARVLGDAEIRAFWAATDPTVMGNFGLVARTLLLTGQRREEVAGMKRSEIRDSLWTLPAARTKNKQAHDVPLTRDVEGLIARAPELGDYVFGASGDAPYSGFSKGKKKLDERMLEGLRKDDPETDLPPWVLHDLRRTARSLMSRAGVRSEVAERVINHKIPGVEAVYNRHCYLDEKREALEALATQVRRILANEKNVVQLRRADRD